METSVTHVQHPTHFCLSVPVHAEQYYRNADPLSDNGTYSLTLPPLSPLLQVAQQLKQGKMLAAYH